MSPDWSDRVLPVPHGWDLGPNVTGSYVLHQVVTFSLTLPRVIAWTVPGRTSAAHESQMAVRS